MKFKEVVKAMRKKKKVKHNEMHGQTHLYLNEDGEIIHVGFDGSINLACHTAIINWVTNDKFDWEVVENVDKDWCLKDKLAPPEAFPVEITPLAREVDVRKMCDLIIEDITKESTSYETQQLGKDGYEIDTATVKNMIKKRSGLYED